MTILRPQEERPERRLVDPPLVPRENVFRDYSRVYQERGFIPVPWAVIDGGKRPIGKGYLEEKPPVQEWRVVFPDANIGIVSRGWIGIDVDSAEHAGKTGEVTIANLSTVLGELPPAPSSTARGADSKSRISFFSIPDDGQRYRDVGKDVEAIRPGHRFAAVFPSVHPNGNLYRWYDRTGALMEEPPYLYELPPLPDRWREYLAAPEPRAGGYEGSVQDWLDELPDGDTPDFIVARLALTEDEFGHSDLVKIISSLVSSGARRQPGIRNAIAAVKDRWLRGIWDDAKHLDEFDKVLDWAVARMASLPEEEKQEEPEQRFQKAAQPQRIEVDKSSLAQSLRTFCTRTRSDFESLLDSNPEVSKKFSKCVALLPLVTTEEDVKLWLTQAKEVMLSALTEVAQEELNA